MESVETSTKRRSLDAFSNEVDPWLNAGDFRALLDKYNVPAPRYTSYPTVPYWEGQPSEAEWLQALSENLESSRAMGRGAALYLHIPFCEKLCTFCGCNTRITRNHEVSKRYIDIVLKEWQLYKDKLGLTQLPFGEMHLGGGTPTFLRPKELGDLLGNWMRDLIPQSPSCSVEVDPRVTTREHLAVLREFGFERISLGVQDFDLTVQKTVNRIQSEDLVRSSVEDARELGYKSINFDLIYGLPKQTQQSVKETLDKVLRMRPDRVAYYAYAHVPWIKPTHRRYSDSDLPTGAEKRDLYEIGRREFLAAGYIEIGMDHFALPEDPLSLAMQSKSLHRNFMGYTERYVSPLLGLGVSAISDAMTVFAQNEKSLESYYDVVERGQIPIFRGHCLTSEDQALRQHILRIMTTWSTEWALNPTPYLQQGQHLGPLEELKKDGLILIDEKGLTVTNKGRPFVRNICMAFDARLFAKAPHARVFSQSI